MLLNDTHIANTVRKLTIGEALILQLKVF